MSEHIVHTAILEDSFALGSRSEEIIPAFRKLMTDHQAFAALGCTTISGDQFSFVLLEAIRPEWETRRPEAMLEQQLAYVLGWISHRATDRQMKPIWTEPPPRGKGYDADPRLSPTECSMYHEGFMFRRYYENHPVYRYAILDHEREQLPVSGLFADTDLNAFIETQLLRNLFEEQTLGNLWDPKDLNNWFEKVTLRRQRFYVAMDRYEQASAHPDPDKVEAHVVQTGFFDEDDRIIRLAEHLRAGGEASAADIRAAVSEQPSSHYGKALLRSYEYFLAASDYYAGAISLDEMKDRLDIGKKGRDGHVV